MDDVLDRLSRLSPDKRAVFEKRLRASRRPTSQTPALSRRTGGREALLSFAQERLWFLDQLSENRTVYSRPFALRLEGPLHQAALVQGINEIVGRHEVLRTSFVQRNGQPMQVVAPFEPLAVDVRDLTELPADLREDAAMEAIMADLRRPFDLTSAPLIRVTLLRLEAEVHILLVTTPHIVFDGWSMGVFFGDLSVFYEALREERPPSLPALPVQYGDFAMWQRRWLQGEVLETQLSYWRKRLEGAPPVLEMPADRPRPPVPSYRGAVKSFELSADLSGALKALSFREGVTVYMTLLAAFKTLLCRYTQGKDIVVGTPIANRSRVETENLIGFFANTLVLRTDLSGDPTFREVLHRVRETTLGAFAHQDLPFEKLVEGLQPARTLSHSPLVQMMFVLQNAVAGPRLRGLAVTVVNVSTGTAKFDLTLSMTEGQENLRGSFEYNTDLFEGGTIDRAAGHFATLLEGIVRHPEQRISRLPILTAQERHRMLVEWNNTETEYPREKCIHELFEEQAERTPDAVALVCAGIELTYQELNRRANKTAHYLMRRGVGPEVMVGIYMERSLEMIIGLVAVLKAGGAYVPLDPAYPSERLAFMVKETAAPVILTQGHLAARLPGTGARVVCLDDEWAAVEEESSENPRSGVTAENLVYVIYTSGSTGLPKGVEAVHRGVVRLMRSEGYAAVKPGGVMLHFTPITFDGATFKIWGCLLNGGRLVLFPPHTPSLEELGRAIRESEISILWLISPLFHQMVDNELASFGKVKQVLVGGEAVSVGHLRRFLQRYPHCTVINAYGPTENTAVSCWYCVPEGGLPGSSVPIGRPVPNSKAYILDAHSEPVPVGVVGELCVGGDGLARGYLHRPDLTAERFIPDPFGDDRASRLYRTGDRARYLADGNIEFLGRLDDQVKIRGYRIECGEIENRLREHPAIEEAAVIAVERGRGGRELAAYVAGGGGAKIADLKKYLGEFLPAAMIPSSFTFLDVLPRTPNGKVDRRALPEPPFSEPDVSEHFIPPANPLEGKIAEVWSDLLHVSRVGRHDDFFALGGHSLLAAQAVARLAENFDVHISLRSFFASPTVSELAAVIESLRHAERGECGGDRTGFVGGEI